MTKKVVLAYSGGLDTSFCIKYLTVEKSVAKSVTGGDLYNKGALWVSIGTLEQMQRFWRAYSSICA